MIVNDSVVLCSHHYYDCSCYMMTRIAILILLLTHIATTIIVIVHSIAFVVNLIKGCLDFHVGRR